MKTNTEIKTLDGRLKTYEHKFFDKIGISLIIFSAFAIFSAISVNLILSSQLFPNGNKLDAQTLGNFFIFIFGTSVTFAGAWVVIQIASKQEELAKNQLEMSTRQEELAKTQLEVEKKGLHEYVTAQNSGDAVFMGIQTLTRKINLLFGFYFRVKKFRDGASRGISSKEDFESQYLLLIETCLMQSSDILKSITDALQAPWVLDLVIYEKDSKPGVVQPTEGGIYLLANKMFFELKKLSTVLDGDLFKDRNYRFDEAFKILSDIHSGIEAFYKCMREIKDEYEKNIQVRLIEEFNSESPKISASIHQKLMRLPLKPSYNILE